MTKAHNPTPEERDERFSLYGLDPEKVGEAVLQSPREQIEKPADAAGSTAGRMASARTISGTPSSQWH